MFKASVFLKYDDESEITFDFVSDEEREDAIATLLMVCRGTLMSSIATSIVAYDEEGFDICSYRK